MWLQSNYMVIFAWESTAEFHSLKQNSVEQLRMRYCNMNKLQLIGICCCRIEKHCEYQHLKNQKGQVNQSCLKGRTKAKSLTVQRAAKVILGESWIRCKVYTNDNYAYSYLSFNLYLPKTHISLHVNSEYRLLWGGFVF